MRHIFKKGDGVICNNAEEVSNLKKLLYENGYNVYNGTNTSFNCIYLDNSGEFMGGNEVCIQNVIPKDIFLKFITKDKKIIGYKSPMDLFRGNWKAGTIFVKDTKNSLTMFYKPKDCVTGSAWTMPEDIVETWEPVFEEEAFKVVTIGSKAKSVIIYKNGNISIPPNETTTIHMVKAILEDLTIHCGINDRVIGTKWKMEIASNVSFLRIGCTNENNLFSLNDLKIIIHNYNRLQN